MEVDDVENTNQPSRIVDEILWFEDRPVTFAWEVPLMRRFAKELDLRDKSLLEVGFGMGLFTGAAQEFSPAHHCVIESDSRCHADALARFGANKGFEALNARWQSIDLVGYGFDRAFYDSDAKTGEGVREFLEFISVCVNGALKKGGHLGFWSRSGSLSPDLLCTLRTFFRSIECGVERDLAVCEIGRRLGFTSDMPVWVAKDFLAR